MHTQRDQTKCIAVKTGCWNCKSSSWCWWKAQKYFPRFSWETSLPLKLFKWLMMRLISVGLEWWMHHRVNQKTMAHLMQFVFFLPCFSFHLLVMFGRTWWFDLNYLTPPCMFKCQTNCIICINLRSWKHPCKDQSCLVKEALTVCEWGPERAYCRPRCCFCVSKSIIS